MDFIKGDQGINFSIKGVDVFAGRIAGLDASLLVGEEEVHLNIAVPEPKLFFVVLGVEVNGADVLKKGGIRIAKEDMEETVINEVVLFDGLFFGELGGIVVK